MCTLIMTHQTFYRKYRSKKFNEIVGQAHIVQTLHNAIQFDRLAHAYIFSGPRGTGKTSTARIFAKALNCRNPQAGEPCLTCDLCEKIARSQSVDVIEMDAASHTGVDHIRVLNDQANFTPVECPYRMFIIDEAHMLSTGAFNALLKTLEEPPAKTIFILATTETHKIPMTIHSRCQHLQFKKMTLEDMTAHLKFIAESEKIQIDEKSLHTVARNAGGCMRDAISLLEQLYAFKGEMISYQDVVTILGSASFDSLFELVEALLKKEAEKVFKLFTVMSRDGVNMMQFASEFTEFLKQLLFVSLNLAHTIDLDESRVVKLQTLAKQTSFETLSSLLEQFSKTEMELRGFPNPELLLQVRFLSAMHVSRGTEAAVAPNAAAPLPVSGGMPARPAVASAPPVLVPVSTPISAPVTAPAPARPVFEQEAPKPVAAPVSMPAQVAAPSFAAPNTAPAPVLGSVPAPSPALTSVTQQPQAPAAPSSGASAWQNVVAQLEKTGKGYAALLKQSQLAEQSETHVHVLLAHDNKFIRDKLFEDKGRALIDSTIQAVFGKPLKFAIGTSANTGGASAGGASSDVTTIKPTQISQKINTIVALFEGQVL